MDIHGHLGNDEDVTAQTGLDSCTVELKYCCQTPTRLPRRDGPGCPIQKNMYVIRGEDAGLRHVLTRHDTSRTFRDQGDNTEERKSLGLAMTNNTKNRQELSNMYIHYTSYVSSRYISTIRITGCAPVPIPTSQ